MIKKRCNNPNCTEEYPVFYDRHAQCKICLRKKQLAYRYTEAGMASHSAYRNSTKGVIKAKKARKKYRSSPKGKIKNKSYDAMKRVNKLTLELHRPFAECDNCIENTSIGCSVVNDAESISVCAVYQEWKHTGIHPVMKYVSIFSEDDYPYQE